ncbi:MAG: Asp-tRNA(Asn)/Glu-tRNA(Gln) amidotransferase subunit GatA [Candidatus Cardinium sp.]|uniref:Asp-tRNA(Asn)/Glu-tRNA(Gln) amidotransferase subunit GatA n=1 Tax=Cardinium endosymbiont of Dermatophagoides farinae TaxID=2597823 RepID=UPI001184613C|nr:Asp-tRNA(Asn)/Glu-tRNA(Gln) amidotransferase subunit GatA [Cardinium endosymbiont of Dermatophagoides farinae]TSJ81089.1 Asp-tRNA(Asn)/Glu-tRNA(Gln) amidotransferase subunit GatA [Cardinium endosymbiont of Dermatophagoides farinae]UWW97128.1 MAG: Asp-tRNA(Asn)/Glu-tRNA(Gln) amidotransferase subunit GatA [Candidatus Cardinium sp.]
MSDHYYSFSALRPLLASQKITVTEVVKQLLQDTQRQKELNAFVNVYDQEIIEGAPVVNQKIKQGKSGPLAGMVIGLKDMIAYKNHPLHAGSKILTNYISPFDATVTQRLLAADALIIGHQNCDEFGMGSSSENAYFGTVLNPLDKTRVAGGSSGGSAAAVKAKMCHVSIGTDTGGSVRQPAAFCGLVGLKPSYGRVSRHGLVAYASSFDTAGIFSHTVEDCATILEVIAGPDAFDDTAATQEVPRYTTALDNPGRYKVACLAETLDNGGLQPEIKEHTLHALELLKKEGHQVDDVHFALLKYALPTYYILVNAEASTNLARFDGIRYGYRSSHATTLEEVYIKTRTEGFAKEVKKRIMLGSFVLSASQCETHYIKALKVRNVIKKAMQDILSQYDFIILPTTTATAFKVNSFANNPLSMYWSDLYTVLASVAGLPAISLPNGVDQKNLPIGIQVIGNYFEEAKLLTFARHFETIVK